MPFIRITTNEKINPEQQARLMRELGEKIEIFEGKSERWLMLEFAPERKMALSGSCAPCSMIEVDILGHATDSEKEKMTAALTDTVGRLIGIGADRVYIKYSEHDTWGWNGINL